MPSEDTQFKPGNPGGPGHPKGQPNVTISLTAAIKRKLEEVRGNTPADRRKVVEHLADNILQDALDGKSEVVKLVWNYVDGMPQQKTDITSGNKPIPFMTLDELRKNNSDSQDSEPGEAS